jgi:hypothetical protein
VEDDKESDGLAEWLLVLFSNVGALNEEIYVSLPAGFRRHKEDIIVGSFSILHDDFYSEKIALAGLMTLSLCQSLNNSWQALRQFPSVEVKKADLPAVDTLQCCVMRADPRKSSRKAVLAECHIYLEDYGRLRGVAGRSNCIVQGCK